MVGMRNASVLGGTLDAAGAGGRVRRARAAAVVGMTIRVVVVDDQELVRSGFAMILDAEDDIEVVGEADDGDTAVEVPTGCDPTWCSWMCACRGWTASPRPGRWPVRVSQNP